VSFLRGGDTEFDLSATAWFILGDWSVFSSENSMCTKSARRTEGRLYGKVFHKGPMQGRLAVFVIRVSYPGGHSVWLTRRFPTVAWGLKKDALPFPTEADAARTIARLRPSGPVSIEPIAPEIAKPA
jgi:hypothetical protein